MFKSTPQHLVRSDVMRLPLAGCIRAVRLNEANALVSACGSRTLVLTHWILSLQIRDGELFANAVAFLAALHCCSVHATVALLAFGHASLALSHVLHCAH